VLLGRDEALSRCFTETRASLLRVSRSFGTHANKCDAWREIVRLDIISVLYLYTIPNLTLLLIKNTFDILKLLDLTHQFTGINNWSFRSLTLLTLKQWESRGAIPMGSYKVNSGSR
jgi:hypothetical protein